MAQWVKNLPAMQETCMGSVPGSGRSPGGGKWQLTPVFLSKISHGQRTLLDYSPKGHKESDMHTHMRIQFSSVQSLSRV